MSDSKEVQVPEGFMMDHRGALVPENIVKEIDKSRNNLVYEIVTKALLLNEELAAFKRQAMNDIKAFVELSAERFDAKVGGNKGNISLTSYDGRYRVLRSINEYITFDESLEAAKALLDDCLESWTSDTSDELRKLVNFAFKSNNAGKLSTQRIMGLLKVDIKDPLWVKAMEAIKESITISGSKAYIRIYKRVGDTDEYKQINLDLAAVDVG